VRRLRLTVYMRDMWAVLAIAMLATPMLSKQVWPYYYLEPVVFIVVWELSTLQDRVAGVWRWPVLSIGFTLVASTLSQYVGLKSVGRLDALTVGVTQTALMAGFTLAVWARIQARKPEARERSQAGAESAQVGLPPMTPPAVTAAGAGQLARQAPAQRPQPMTPSASEPYPQGERWQAPRPGPRSPQQPGPQPGPYGPGAAPTPPGPRGAVAPAPPAWQAPGGSAPLGNSGSLGASGPLGGATPPRGVGSAAGPATPPNQPKQPNQSSQLWPGGADAPFGRAPAPTPAEPRPASGPGQQQETPSGAIDPWRDWPQGR